MTDFLTQQWLDVCAALGVDPDTTLSVNVTPGWVRIVHASQAVTSMPVADGPLAPPPAPALPEED